MPWLTCSSTSESCEKDQKMPCYIEESKLFGQLFICAHEEIWERCAACMGGANCLCDFPVGNGKTCGLPLCAKHSHEIAPNLHYWHGHFELWKAFAESGGIKRALENTVPFRRR
jgi:hypothetical protein